MLSPTFLSLLETDLIWATHDTNQEIRMGDYGFKSLLRPQPKPRPKTEPISVEVPIEPEYVPQALAEITVETKVTVRPMQLQGLAAKMALLKHNLEAEAAKLGSRVDGAASKSTETFAKSHQFLDATDKDLADVENFIAELGAVTNGGPAIEDPK